MASRGYAVKAVVADGAGGPEVLRVQEMDVPRPSRSEVLIQVAAAGVNRADVLQRAGYYPPPPGATAVLGLECSGRIVKAGKDVREWSVGERVCALMPGGGYAEYAAVAANQVLPADGLLDIDAAALPETFCTVWWNVFMRARLRPGETILIHGGLSGIGTTAIQLARHHGARVFCTAGTNQRCEQARELGAELAVNYRDDDFAEAIRDRTSGRGVDVILDIVGAKYLSRHVEALADGGRIIVIGLQGGRHAEIDLSALLARNGTLHATSLRNSPAWRKERIVSAVRRHVLPLVRTGALRPVVDSALPLADVVTAHRRMESGAHSGKIVLTMDANLTSGR